MASVRALAFALTLSALAPAVSGCAGFTPLYASGAVAPAMSAIAVEAPDGRTAYLLREALDDTLGRDRSLTPLYRLTYALDETRTPRGLGADNAASRYELSLKVTYRLADLAGVGLKSGETTVLITYGAIDAPYAGVVAQNDSQARAAQEAARRIRLDLAEYFASRPSLDP